MKKLINAPADYVEEMLEGLVAAHPDLSLVGEEKRVVERTHEKASGKVGIASGGGSGHLPLFTGYVGEGLLDSCAIGNVFEGPNVDSCMEAIRRAERGAGVLCLYGNYGGDRMNFDMAGEMLEAEGIPSATVLGNDDIASATPDEPEKRRGVAGIVYAYKAAGAKAEAGADLKEVTRVARKAVAATRSIGVALTPCRIPTAKEPNFTIAEDEIEMGMGIHGEAGIWRAKKMPADAVVDEMLERLLEDRPLAEGEKLSVLVNGLGGTPLEELLILYRRAAQNLSKLGAEIVMPLVGNFVTSMEMKGASISLHHMDAELEGLLRAPASCPFWSVS